MGRTSAFLFALFFAFSFLPTPTHQVDQVDVGVVLEMGSRVGRASWLCLQMGLEDFYAAHPGHGTRIALHRKDSGNDSVGAASAALDLLKNVQVQAILGPERSAQASFVIDLGSKTQVPIVSFSVTSPSLSPAQKPYFIRTAVSSLFQVNAIASIVKNFGWRAVVPIYEDTEYGIGLLPHLVDALQNVDARVPSRSAIPPSATDIQITSELYRLMTMQTRVFVVHMLPPLSSRLFLKVKELGMMSERYVWIITAALAEHLDTLEQQSTASMQGVVGLKTFVPESKDLANFTARWRARFNQEYPNVTEENLIIYGLWAYDTAWAMATAVENVGADNLSFKPLNISGDSTDLAKLGVSQNGPRLKQAILNTKFKAIGGEFHLVDGQLQSSILRIVNLVRNEWKEVGFWTQADGISLQASSTGSNDYSASKMNSIIWPGGLHDAPKGWEISTNGKILQVGVPIKGGFDEFVNTKAPYVTGYSIDVFDAVMATLPYSVRYHYVAFEFAQHPGSYNDLIDQVVFQKFDAVVGDVTIIANRSLYVDFTLPYTESGVSMVVPIKEDQDNNAWIFVKPLTTALWLGSLAFFFFTGFVVWVIEHRINEEFRGPPSQQMGTILYFVFSTLVFSHAQSVNSNLSRFVVIVWVFVVLILTSSYTASLASMLTVERFKPTVTDVRDLLENGENVGYQDGSFVMGFLKGMGFKESRLKNYTSPDAYAEALSRGSRNGGVAAIIDEIPYIKLFLKERCSKYKMVGPTYKTDGFGFVFPKGSPLVPDVSRAVLNVTQGDRMPHIEKLWFGDQTACPTKSRILSSNRLQFSSFWGLFLITGVVSVMALLIFLGKFWYDNSSTLKRAVASEKTLWKKLAASIKHYDNKDCSSHAFRKDNELTSANIASTMTAMDISPMTPNTDGSQSPFSTSDKSFANHGPLDQSVSSVD